MWTTYTKSLKLYNPNTWKIEGAGAGLSLRRLQGPSVRPCNSSESCLGDFVAFIGYGVSVIEGLGFREFWAAGLKVEAPCGTTECYVPSNSEKLKTCVN